MQKKLFIKFIIFLSLITIISCGKTEEALEDCLPAELSIKNSSIYDINAVYIHDNADFSNDLSRQNLGQLAPDEEIPVNIDNNDIKYFTFVRNITSTSGIEINVTTQYPIEFKDCKSYTLNLLEEDFFLEQEDNVQSN